jgi:hypothetical protein
MPTVTNFDMGDSVGLDTISNMDTDKLVKSVSLDTSTQL